MGKPTTQLLTYLAQVRQLPFKNGLLLPVRVSTTRRILLIKQHRKLGTSRKGIVITGIVLVAGWEELNRNTGVWSMVVGYWRKTPICISLRSLVEARK
jgi:hypothetical protein